MIGQAIILGSGTSNGCPSLGFDYDKSFLANPKNWRTRTSILLKGYKGNLLVDCAPEMRLQLLRHDIKDIEATLITHTHADHIMGMDDLRCFELRSNKSMTVYAQPDDQEVIRRVFSYAFGEFPTDVHVPKFTLRDVPEVIEVGGLEVRTMIVKHGEMPVIALRVGNFAYVTDVSEIPEAAWNMLLGLDTLVLDAVRRRPHPNHFHFQKAIDIVKELAPKKTFFTHLSHDFDHDIVERDELPPHIRLCYDGMEIDINDVVS